jgi:hypothetical protein
MSNPKVEWLRRLTRASMQAKGQEPEAVNTPRQPSIRVK